MSESKEGLELREALERSRDGLGRARASRALRARVSEYALKRSSEGATFGQVASELGIGATSVGRWVREPERRALVPVELHDESPSGFVVHARHGVRVEGLSVPELARLLRALS